MDSLLQDESVCVAQQATMRSEFVLNSKVRRVDAVYEDTDKEPVLELFCYTKCSPKDDVTTKMARGVVLSGDKVVSRCFDFVPEYTPQEMRESPSQKLKGICTDTSNYIFQESHEGAMLRLFNHNGEWFLTTHRKLNAFQSKWSSKTSFGEMFVQAIYRRACKVDEFCNLLGLHRLDTSLVIPANETTNTSKFDLIDFDKNNAEVVLDAYCKLLNPNFSYNFLLEFEKENRIVCSHDSPRVLFIGKFFGDAFSMDGEETGLDIPVRRSFADIQDMLEFVDKLSNNPFKIQGLMAYKLDPCDEVEGDKGFDWNFWYRRPSLTKIVNEDYQKMNRLRGGEASVKFRYLQVRMSRRSTQGLKELYPEFIEEFDKYEQYLCEVAESLYQGYQNRYIKKNFHRFSRDEFSIIRKCHQQYEMTRKKITLKDVVNILNTQNAVVLNRFIRNQAHTASQRDSLVENRNFNTPSYGGLDGSEIPLSPISSPISSPNEEQDVSVVIDGFEKI